MLKSHMSYSQRMIRSYLTMQTASRGSIFSLSQDFLLSSVLLLLLPFIFMLVHTREEKIQGSWTRSFLVALENFTISFNTILSPRHNFISPASSCSIGGKFSSFSPHNRLWCSVRSEEPDKGGNKILLCRT